MVYFVQQALYFFLPVFTTKIASYLMQSHAPHRGKLPAGIKVPYTWYSIVAGILSGSLVFSLQKYVLFDLAYDLSIIDYADFPLGYGLLLSAGAMLGDLFVAFSKSRYGLPVDEVVIPWDAWGYVLGSVVFSFWYYVPNAGIVAIGLAATLGFQLLLIYWWRL